MTTLTQRSVLVLSTALALAFIGCGKTSDPKSETTVAAKTEAAVKDAAANATGFAIDAKDTFAAKLADWKLSPSDIKADLEKTGRVVRSKAAAVGAKTGEVFDNARVVTVINAKLVADGQLSALKINVDAADHMVTLRGNVGSVELIGRAITLALDTDGVNQVVSHLNVSAEM